MGEIEGVPLEDAFEVADLILELLREIPARGEEFSRSVEDKVLAIRADIEERGHCTVNQMRALGNMLAGARRWLK